MSPSLTAYRAARVLAACATLDRFRTRIAAALDLRGTARRHALYRLRFELDGAAWPVADADGRDPGIAFAARILADDIGRAMYGDAGSLDALAMQVGRVQAVAL